ncbi:glutamate--tRNA ligase [Candidatus Poribacteria bacterium]|nr:MAG: glutamate--tRNA ligase [Candidatus Poribacteria bacterium]
MNDTPSGTPVSAVKDQVRVRMAPSPTGYLHIGGARTALFNWLFAKHHNGKFILRIDDTDTARSTDESMHEIYDALRWLGINWDEQYVQSERRNIYNRYVTQLIHSDNAYFCYCTPEELEDIRAQARADKQPRSYDRRCRHLTSEDLDRFIVVEDRRPTIRIKMPDTPIPVEDLVLGSRNIDPETLEDEVIVRSNGMPNYNLTSIIDDAEMQITHVIRGTEHLNNTPKQIAIANALGLKVPQFAHIPLVLDSSGRKMSKRHHGDLVAVNRYREQGYLPEAVLNFVVRLGWSYDDKQEIFSVDELIEKFDLERVGKSGSVFDIKKLEWLNSHYINQLSISARTDAVIPFWQAEGLINSTERRDWLEDIVEAVGERLTTLQDILPQTRYFFTDEFEYEPKAVKKWWGGSEEKREKTSEMLTNLLQILEEVPSFDIETVETAIWKYTDENDIKRVAAMQALRIALTGTSFGPSLFDIVALLGRDEVLKRIPKAIEHL